MSSNLPPRDPTQLLLSDPAFRDRVNDRLGATSKIELRLVEGGHSGLTLCAAWPDRRGDIREVILKVAPPGRPPTGRHDVLRQARVLEALAGNPELMLPQIIAFDAGEPPWFAMEFVVGDATEPLIDGIPLEHADRWAELSERSTAAGEQLVALHGAEIPNALVDEPVVGPAQELARWRETMHAVPEELRPGSDQLGAALSRDVPTLAEVVVTHGDYRLGNVLGVGPRVAAIIDWEISALGDPRSDLAWFGMYSDPRCLGPAGHPLGALPSEARLIEDYERSRPGSTSCMLWFRSLARYKLAAVIGHNLKRHLEGRRIDQHQERLRPAIVPLLESGLRCLEGRGREGPRDLN